jgi:hypothetical protein
MIMQDQSRRLSQPLQWGRREKTVVAVMLSCLLVAVVALGVYGLTKSSPSRKGCIDLSFASTLGVAQIHDCGGQARKLCASPNPSSEFAQELREDCRRVGYPFGTG